MGCAGCINGRGATPAGCGNKGHCASGSCAKLNTYDWLASVPPAQGQSDQPFVEVQFKNGRKEFFRDEEKLGLKKGDIVAVEAATGHDIGIVSLSTETAALQMRRKKASTRGIRKVCRLAKPGDIEKWAKAMDLEHDAMLNARQFTKEFKLDMKINDVEYQGDRTKAIFYYTAEDRVDFRELIKKLASEFRVRVEMKQIGIRQEAGRLGGLGSCGRELCCSTGLTDFQTVSTSAARYQQLAINPQKLAGQCGKLKCCLNYELDSYMEAVKEFPRTDQLLETQKGQAFHQKTDIFKRLMWYSYKEDPNNFICLPLDRVNEIIQLNKEQEKPDDLLDKSAMYQNIPVEPDFKDVISDNSLTRFDRTKKKSRGKGRKGGNRKKQNRGRRPSGKKPNAS